MILWFPGSVPGQTTGLTRFRAGRTNASAATLPAFRDNSFFSKHVLLKLEVVAESLCTVSTIHNDK